MKRVLRSLRPVSDRAGLRYSLVLTVALALLLASDDARGVTGQAWNVDGGAVQA